MKYIIKSDKSNAQEVLEAIKMETSSFRKLLKKFGYEADYCFFEKGTLKMKVFSDGTRKYQPKIYINGFSSELDFEIQTTSYGALTKEEYTKYLESCNLAMTTVIFLQNYDYSNFPEVEFEN